MIDNWKNILGNIIMNKFKENGELHKYGKMPEVIKQLNKSTLYKLNNKCAKELVYMELSHHDNPFHLYYQINKNENSNNNKQIEKEVYESIGNKKEIEQILVEKEADESIDTIEIEQIQQTIAKEELIIKEKEKEETQLANNRILLEKLLKKGKTKTW